MVISGSAISHWNEAGQSIRVGFGSLGTKGHDSTGSGESQPWTASSRSSTPPSRTAIAPAIETIGIGVCAPAEAAAASAVADEFADPDADACDGVAGGNVLDAHPVAIRHTRASTGTGLRLAIILRSTQPTPVP